MITYFRRHLFSLKFYEFTFNGRIKPPARVFVPRLNVVTSHVMMMMNRETFFSIKLSLYQLPTKNSSHFPIQQLARDYSNQFVKVFFILSDT